MLGNNNAFEIAIQSELALVYSENSVLERHHASTTLKMLNQSEFFQNCFSEVDKVTFRKLTTSTILATDMAHHFELCDKVARLSTQDAPFALDNADSRRDLMCLLCHSADIGAQTQATPLARKWGNVLMKEFATQAEREKTLGLVVTPFMMGLDDELTRNKLQSGFVTNIVEPLWKSLEKCLPEIGPAVESLMTNKKVYADAVAEIQAQRDVQKPSTI